MVTPEWDVPRQIHAISSTRKNGVSRDPYQSLNLAMHVGDHPDSVAENRKRIQAYSGMPDEPVWMNQTHSTTVVEIDHPTSVVVDADGLFTRTRGIVCAVMTADCLPILMTNTAGTEVAAVHAGWRGLANGIIEEAAALFSGEVLAWIGPAIGKHAFEVGSDVMESFTRLEPLAESAFVPREQNGKWLADLDMLARQRFHHLGIERVFSSGLCTFSDAQNFFSFRRDGVTGRQASFIWIE